MGQLEQPGPATLHCPVYCLVTPSVLCVCCLSGYGCEAGDTDKAAAVTLAVPFLEAKHLAAVMRTVLGPAADVPQRCLQDTGIVCLHRADGLLYSQSIVPFPPACFSVFAFVGVLHK